MEKYAARYKNKNFMLKLTYDLPFGFWNLGLYQVFPLSFIYQSFQILRKIELKTQLPVVSKKKKKKHALNFEDMENQLFTNSSFVNSLQNVQSRFLI